MLQAARAMREGGGGGSHGVKLWDEGGQPAISSFRAAVGEAAPVLRGAGCPLEVTAAAAAAEGAPVSVKHGTLWRGDGDSTECAESCHLAPSEG